MAGNKFSDMDGGKLVVDPKLGTKRACESCGAKFYDLNKDPAVCPKCGHSFDPMAAFNQTQPTREIKPEVDEAEDDDEEDVLDDEEDAISLDEISDEASDDEEDEVLADFDDDEALLDDDEDDDEESFLEEDDED